MEIPSVLTGTMEMLIPRCKNMIILRLPGETIDKANQSQPITGES